MASNWDEAKAEVDAKFAGVPGQLWGSSMQDGRPPAGATLQLVADRHEAMWKSVSPEASRVEGGVLDKLDRLIADQQTLHQAVLAKLDEAIAAAKVQTPAAPPAS